MKTPITLREARINRELSVEEVAKYCKKTIDIIEEFEKDSSNIPPNLLISLLKLYNVNPESIFWGNESYLLNLRQQAELNNDLFEDKIMTSELDQLPEILTAKHIAEYLKISRRRVYELFQLNPEYGGIPNFEIGASKRVEKDDFIKWISEQKSRKANKYKTD